MKRITLALSAAVCLGLTSIAAAQPPGGAGGGPNFDAFDENKDGSVSKEELTAFFTRMRTNAPAGAGGAGGPGAGGPGAGGPGGGMFNPDTLFERWDANKDGSISKQEFDERPRMGPPGAGGPGQG